MILVFGGTTEGKKIATLLEQTDYAFWYSTKTQVEVDLPMNGTYCFGAFTSEALVSFCQRNEIKTIIHASHPFAELLHTTIGEASLRLGIPVLRLERQFPERMNHPLVHYVASYPELISLLRAGNYASVLALTGVQSIEKLRDYWQTNRVVFRILPRESSAAMASEMGFPISMLIGAFAGRSSEEEQVLIRQTGAQAIVTKESGESGFLSVKIAAAIAMNVPIYILRRPTLPAHFIEVTQEETWLATLRTCTHESIART